MVTATGPSPAGAPAWPGAHAGAACEGGALLRGVPLPHGVPGRLWLSAMPGRFEPLRRFLAESQQREVGLVVCLTPMDELAALSPAYHRAVAQGELPFRWMDLPMRNFGLPPELPAFQDGLGQVADALRGGESVLLHCAAGLGRTGSAAACVLKALGLPAAEALERVHEAGSNPQNAQQSGLVERF